MLVRHGPCDGVHIAVNGKQRVFGHTLVKCLYVRVLDDRSRGGFSRDHGASTM